jgi:hypothetical protein
MARPHIPPSAIQPGLPDATPPARSSAALEQIEVASPCHAAWDEMTGDDRARFCRQCEKHVYNLSGMTRAEAQALVNQTEGRLCVRFYRRSDGTIMTQDCPVGVAALRRPLYLVAGLVTFVAASLGLVTVGTLTASSLRDDNGPWPAPVQMVLDWLFPPAVCVMGAPAPIAPNAANQVEILEQEPADLP